MDTISVIIPCHNAAPYIGEAIASIGAQTLRPTDVIIVNDASDDASVGIAESTCQSHDLHVKVLNVELRNAAAARNAGIAVSESKWIALLDADDVWYPNHLLDAMTLMKDSDDVAYMANHHWLRGRDHTEIPTSLRPKIDESTIRLSSTRFTDLLSLGFHFGHSTVIYRRSRVLQIGGFDESQRRRHDIDLWLRMVAGNTWTWGSKPAACYRIDTPGSISKNIIEAEYFYLRALLRNFKAYESRGMHSLVKTSARRATSLAFTDGTWDQYQRVKPLAWPFLAPGFRVSYRLAERWPSILRQGIHIKRKLLSFASNLR